MKVGWAKVAVACGKILSICGIAMNYAWDRMSEVEPAPRYLGLLEHAFTPVFVVGLLAMSAGCVALSREWMPRMNYIAGGVCVGTVPLMMLLMRLGVVRFELDAGFADWTMMLLVFVFTVFALGLMFLVAGVSWRRWE